MDLRNGTVTRCLASRPLVGSCLILCLLVVALPAQALNQLNVTDRDQQILGPHLMWAAAPDDGPTAGELASDPDALRWRPVDGDTLNLGLRESPIWLAVYVRSDATTDRYLNIAYPPLDDVHVHLIRADDGESLMDMRTGDARPFSSRPVSHPDYAVPLALESGERYLLLMRVQTEGSLQVPASLWQRDAFLEHTQATSALQMMFFGIMGALAIYNLLLYVAIRDSAYLWYVVYLLSFVSAQAALRGSGFQYLWPSLPAFNAISLPVFFSLSVAAVGFFTLRFLNMPSHSRAWTRALLAIGWLGVVLAGLSLVLPYHLIIAALIPVVTGGSLVALIAALQLWWRGVVLARFYVIAWGIFLFSNILYALSKAGLMPATALTDHSPQVGAVIQMLLLSFALAWRINQEKEQRQEARAEALRVQRDANLKLERRVEERTDELRQAYDQLKELSELDGLTQLKNRPYFDQALKHEWRRSCRETNVMSLLMLDLDEFKAVNDTYGHVCGDEALRRIASICQETVGRVADTVARYGGEEFVILLPMTELAGAAVVAERIRDAAAALEFEWEGNRIPLTLSVGVTCCVPDCEGDYEWLVRTADEALYEAKARGRNRTLVARQIDNGGIELVTPEALQAPRD